MFQRTANYTVPAYNGPLPEHRREEVFADYPAYLEMIKKTRGGQTFELGTDKMAADFTPEEQRERLEKAWQLGRWNLQSCFRDITINEQTNAMVAGFFAEKVREIVKDPATAEKLTPKGYPLGTKRLCLDSDYFDTFNRDTVDLVDINEEPIVRITETGLQTSEKEYPADIIIFAIGFDAMTGPLVHLGIEGRGGESLKQAWSDGPTSYLGLAVPGFPNMFTVNGPSSVSVLSNMIMTVEHHVDLIAECIEYMRKNGYGTIEAQAEATEEWAAHTEMVANRTLFPKANSWYMGANVPGKPRMFMAYIGGFDNYVARCGRGGRQRLRRFQPHEKQNRGRRVSAIRKDGVAVITGAAGGIGYALAEQALRSGMNVVISDIREEALETARANLAGQGADVLAVRADVTSEADVNALADAAVEHFGKVNVLVNNAGAFVGGLAWETSAAQMDWIVDLNFKSVAHGIRAFVPRMIAQGDACHVLTVASAAGISVYPGYATYSPTKHAALALTEALYLDLLSEGIDTIGVTVVMPGMVRTDIMAPEKASPGALALDRDSRHGNATVRGIEKDDDQGACRRDAARGTGPPRVRRRRRGRALRPAQP